MSSKSTSEHSSKRRLGMAVAIGPPIIYLLTSLLTLWLFFVPKLDICIKIALGVSAFLIILPLLLVVFQTKTWNELEWLDRKNKTILEVFGSNTKMRRRNFENVMGYLNENFIAWKVLHLPTNPEEQLKNLKNEFQDIVLGFFECDATDVSSNLAYRISCFGKNEEWKWIEQSTPFSAKDKSELTSDMIANNPCSTFYSVVKGYWFQFNAHKEDVAISNIEDIRYKGGKRKPSKISWQRLIRSGFEAVCVKEDSGTQSICNLKTGISVNISELSPFLYRNTPRWHKTIIA